ncbi:DUF4157 domain-containing protein [Leptolyngbya sp. Cla-17]|uniref:eCIS core domain-containing protein n=1 Tax=Leptolyngbya sp. Cla-17 TaxID=2803751 RepID=UPI0018DA0679|nr:DUF4157 domain-containing protein [Leptolyngbya sp. Cla-17]
MSALRVAKQPEDSAAIEQIHDISQRPQFSGLSGELGVAASQFPIQAKLTIGQPNDRYEQEADQVAAQVVQQINAPASVQSSQGQSVQRTEAREGEAIQAKTDKNTINRKEEIAGGEASTNLESAIRSARGGGQPLDLNLQQSMGQAMGADFSGVKVHTDAQADQLNRSVQAKAFTTGRDMFFRQGAYDPRSGGGQELIAHELTHVVQQRVGAGRKSPLPLNPLLKQSLTEIPSVSLSGCHIQAASENTQVHGITTLVTLERNSKKEDFVKSVYGTVSDGDIVEIDNVTRHANLNYSQLSDSTDNWDDSEEAVNNATPKTTWYPVINVNGYYVEEKLYIRDGTFHRISVTPTIKTIEEFFDKLTTGIPKPDLSDSNIDLADFNVKREENIVEFGKRLTTLNPNIEKSKIEPLFEQMVDIFRHKKVSLVKKFLDNLTHIGGLSPLETESERIFWSGGVSREEAKKKASESRTALETTPIGTLLDKLPLYNIKGMNWHLTTLLWAEISRRFSVGTRGEVNVYQDGGFAKENVFWTDELPALRLLQRYGKVTQILLHVWEEEECTWRVMDLQSPEVTIKYDKSRQEEKPDPATSDDKSRQEEKPDPATSDDKSRQEEKPDPATSDKKKAYRYEKPTSCQYVRSCMMKHGQRLEHKNKDGQWVDRKKPILFYRYRLKTGVFADASKVPNGIDVRLYNYGSAAKRECMIEGAGGVLKEIIRDAEEYLMNNYPRYESIPPNLVFRHSAEGGERTMVAEGGQPVAVKGASGMWSYVPSEHGAGQFHREGEKPFARYAKQCGVFCESVRMDWGREVTLIQIGEIRKGQPEQKSIKLVGTTSEQAALQRDAEAYLLENHKAMATIPGDLEFRPGEVREGRRVIANQPAGGKLNFMASVYGEGSGENERSKKQQN